MAGYFILHLTPENSAMQETREAVAAQLIQQLLSANSPEPELGARLKQRLIAAFVANGLGVFDEKALGFRQFSEYLQRVHGGLVVVHRQEGIGDILVSLKGGITTARLPASPVLPASKVAGPVIRSAVWQAFANPDPERKRFFKKQNGGVVHYLNSQQGPEKASVEAAPDEFIEIPPISAETQSAWMREFLTSAPLQAEERAALEPLVAESYSSTVNAMFSRALGARGLAWRAVRTANVTAIIEQWARANGVAPSLLYVKQETSKTIELSGVSASGMAGAIASPVAAPLSGSVSPAREQVLKLLELLTDDDLSRLVLPTLLSTIMIKSRL
ncbi:hypothetical protein R0290_07745 [Burkholderia semiarida]|uniref:hypothetical protein n=1 Tax=Burkholderia TaxID=32008 RepID=UPI00265FF71B|nr:hypothetical protein [Burkholderia sp. AU44665]MDN7702292.1 hypothetical protein [Burkholderia sp. AU44665]